MRMSEKYRNNNNNNNSDNPLTSHENEKYYFTHGYEIEWKKKQTKLTNFMKLNRLNLPGLGQ